MFPCGFVLTLTFALFHVAAPVEVDKNGYVVFCPCMGRFGNQADHYLGALSFAHGLGRTLILPPWVEYHRGEINSVQVPFDTYFKVEGVQEYHRVITMEKFMKELAPTIWPEGKRTIFCYSFRDGKEKESCNAKDGNPFGPFWDTFNIEFDHSETYGPLFYDTNSNPKVAKEWNKQFPASRYPVLAFTGAPASFPIMKNDVPLQAHFQWSDNIAGKAQKFIKDNIPQRPFLGIHMRNGVDWERACEHVNHGGHLFASPQCLGYSFEYGAKITRDMCLPPDKLVLRQVERLMKKTKSKALFIATDDRDLIPKFEKHLKKLQVKIVKHTPSEPHVDLAILGQADYYIGNCISTFSSFATRERRVHGKPVEFWAFKPNSNHDEL